jgi:hypothetical protein
MVWDSRHPRDKNPRWSSLNEGQKRYAEEQWKLARLRHGLGRIYDPNEQEEISNIEREMLAGAPPDNPEGSTTRAPPTPARPDISDFDDNLFDSSRTTPPNHPGNPGLGFYRAMSTPMDVSSTGDSGANPSPASSSSRGASKRKRINDNTLPGTAGGQGGVGGASTEGPVLTIARPVRLHSTGTRTFGKAWKILTFGIAPNVITENQTAPATSFNYYFTTSLASLPVHLLRFYMTRHEFGLMRPGERVVELSVKVTQRNVRVAFETSASTSGLATLNQNKNGLCATGLNLTGLGCDSTIATYDTTEPMKPLTLTTAAYLSEQSMYGVQNNDSAFPTTIPAYVTGLPLGVNTYWTSSTNDGYTGGWATIQDCLEIYDAADAVGQEVCHYTYKPLQGTIKPWPLPRIAGNPGRVLNSITQIPNARAVRNLGQLETLSNAGVGTVQPTATAPVLSESTQSTRSLSSADTSTIFDYGQTIEKSQILMAGTSSPLGCKVQPSLHIGVEPVPKLQTPDLLNNAVASSWTDVQAYFDVETSMTTSWTEFSMFPRPRINPLQGETDLSWEQDIFYNTLVTNNQSSTLLGRYTTDARNNPNIV